MCPFLLRTVLNNLSFLQCLSAELYASLYLNNNNICILKYFLSTTPHLTTGALKFISLKIHFSANKLGYVTQLCCGKYWGCVKNKTKTKKNLFYIFVGMLQNGLSYRTMCYCSNLAIKWSDKYFTAETSCPRSLAGAKLGFELKLSDWCLSSITFSDRSTFI